MAPACSHLPGQSLKAIFDFSQPLSLETPPMSSTLSVLLLWLLYGQLAPLFPLLLPQARLQHISRELFQELPKLCSFIHLYRLISPWHCCQPSSESKLTSNYCFSQECLLDLIAQRIILKLLSLMLILKPPVADKGKEGLCPIRFIEVKLFSLPWQSSSVALVSIYKWIIANKFKIQNCKREPGERQNGAERLGWVFAFCLCT